MMSEKYCPVCGKEANSPHHVRPRGQGGTDDPKNICWLCRQCHDLVDEMQEETGLGLCPELIYRVRQKLHIKLERDKDGIEESWIYPNFLVWICLPGKTKVWICQYIGDEPSTKAGQTQTIEIVAESNKRRRGFPGKPEISTSYLEELIYNKGLTYEVARKHLLAEGFSITRQAIWKRLRNSNNHHPIQQVACKQCGTIFTPKGNRFAFCTTECDLVYYRKNGKSHDAKGEK